MKKLILFAIVLIGLYLYLNWKPSAVRIAGEMQCDEVITCQGRSYESDRGDVREERGIPVPQGQAL